MMPVFAVPTLARILDEPIPDGITEIHVNGHLRMPDMTVACPTCRQPISRDAIVDYQVGRELMWVPRGTWMGHELGPWLEWTIWHAGHKPGREAG